MFRGLFCWMLFLPVCSQAQTFQAAESWEEYTVFPAGRRDDGSAIAHGGMLFMGLGIDQSYVLQSDWWSFDTERMTWERLSDLPSSPRQYSSVFTHGDLIYVVAGDLGNSLYSDEVFAFNTRNKEWLELSNADWSPRAAAVTFTIGHRTYLCGGRNLDGPFNDCWCFDSSTLIWTEMASLPFEGRDEMIGFSSDGSGYVLLGRTREVEYGDVWRFNPEQNEWSREEDFPGIATSYAACVSTHRGSIVAGGQDSFGNLLSESFYFDTEQGRWFKLPDLAIREIRGMQLMFTGEEVYSYGGLTNNFTRVEVIQRLQFSEVSTEEDALEIRQNPVSDWLMFSLIADPAQEWKFELIDIQGRRCAQLNPTGPYVDVVWDVRNIQSGYYIIRAISNSETFTRSFIKVQ